MKREHIIRIIAGTIILITLALGYYSHPHWHYVTAFVGVNLIQSAFTKFCLMEKILCKLGIGTT